MKRQSNHCVLGLHPSSRGFGWVLLEKCDSVFDWGTADVREDKNTEALNRIRHLLDKYRPRAIAMEAFADTASRRTARIRELCESIGAEAHRRNVAVRTYTRNEVHGAFRGTKTRQEVAVAVARMLPVLKPRLPKPRKAWESERANTALFQAAACALTYFALRDRGP